MFSLLAHGSDALADLPVWVAMMHPTLRQEIVLGVAAAVTLCGVWLCWTAPRHRMSVEEHAKDGHMTEADARRRVRNRATAGPALIIAGLAVLAWVVLF